MIDNNNLMENIDEYISEYINNNFKEENNINDSLNNLNELISFCYKNEIYLEMLDLNSIINNNDKLKITLKNIINKLDKNLLKKINNDIIINLIINYANINNISNYYVNTLRNNPINPYDDIAQRKLIERVQKGDKKAKELIILTNERLVQSIVNRQRNKLNYVSLTNDDLLQEGRIAIMQAALKFDLNRKNKFSTYAVPYIIKNIYLAIYKSSRGIKLPFNVYYKVMEYNYLKNKWFAEYGYYPSYAELASLMEISLEKVKEIAMINLDVISLEKEITNDSDDETNLLYYLSDPKEDFIEDVIFKTEIDTLKYRLDKSKNITERNKEIIRLRYGLNDGVYRTLTDIGHMYNLERERIRRIIVTNLKLIGYDKYLNRIDNRSLVRTK